MDIGIFDRRFWEPLVQSTVAHAIGLNYSVPIFRRMKTPMEILLIFEKKLSLTIVLQIFVGTAFVVHRKFLVIIRRLERANCFALNVSLEVSPYHMNQRIIQL